MDIKRIAATFKSKGLTMTSFDPKRRELLKLTAATGGALAYQTVYQMLGSWAVAADNGSGSKEMHVVYASPGTIAAYRKDGHFPDGTVLVKEVFKTTTKDMTTGIVSSIGTLAGWFVMVKDNVGRFPGNKLWGDGWGWSWFDATDPQKTTSTDYTTDCQSCHVPAQASDWIYTHGYPPLNR